MLSRLPRELLEELVVLRKRYSFVYSNNALEIWVDGALLFWLDHVIAKPLKCYVIYSWAAKVRLSITHDSIQVNKDTLTLSLPLGDCDIESFHHAMSAIPLVDSRP